MLGNYLITWRNLVWLDVAGRRGRFEWHLLRHQPFNLKGEQKKNRAEQSGKGGRFIFPTLISVPDGEGI